MNGELVGIVNAKSSSSDAEGLGFAIPINDAIKVAQELLENGYVTGRPYLGITYLAVTDAQTASQLEMCIRDRCCRIKNTNRKPSGAPAVCKRLCRCALFAT